MHLSHRIFLTGAAVLWAALFSAHVSWGAEERAPLSLQIDAQTPVAAFRPGEAFGAGIDGMNKEDLENIYAPENVKAMAGAPYNRLSYRLRTELGIEAWHWNQAGTWSEGSRRQGYWTSRETTKKPLLRSFGYKLPRRGSTIDQAGNDGYSRLDDGRTTTFWKSNPYLDAHFTGEDNARHAQWVLIDLGQRSNVNALRIFWHEPYATNFEVQYWDGQETDYINHLISGAWRSFTNGRIQNGKGGDSLLRLEDNPRPVRFVRILMKASSGTAPKRIKSKDIRDRLGYAIRELYLGVLDNHGKLNDLIQHGASNGSQTHMVVSSTDPWHRAVDRNNDSAHPGFDRVIASKLGRNHPILIPVSIMYDTPENAAAEIRFLKSRGFPVRQIELGEEPDGQNISPEDYGALYLQFARAIHAVDPTLVTGGPSLQSEVDGWEAIVDEYGEHSWMKRFIRYLRDRNSLDKFGFFSFEWYPFDDVSEPPTGPLTRHTAMMKKGFARLVQEGVPRDIPWIISEYGYSAFSGKVEVELPGALLNAEVVAQSLLLGGTTAYYYGLEPREPIRELDSGPEETLWGNLMMIQTGPGGKAKWLLPAYYGAKMMVEEWAEPVDKPHQLFQTQVTATGGTKPDEVTAFAVRRPDGRWALLLLNKGVAPVNLGPVSFKRTASEISPWSGPLEAVQYSSKQYTWQASGAQGHPVKSEPPERFQVAEGFAAGLTLPPMSITVVRSGGAID